jgi:hypothetical protein
MKDKKIILGVAASIMFSHVLLIIAAFIVFSVLLSFLISMDDMDVEAQKISVMNFTVANSAPTVGAVSCDHVGLTEGNDYIAWCWATVTDLNGYQDVVGCNGTFFRNSALQTGVANQNNRYFNSSCFLFGGNANTVTCNCSFGMKYFADGNVLWTGNITAYDSVSSGFNAGAPIKNGGKIAQITAIQLPVSAAQLGSLTVGTATTFNAFNYTTANNTGNQNQSVQVAAATAQMNCAPSPANIPLTALKCWVQDAGQAWAAGGQLLTASATDVAGDWILNRQASAPGTVENRSIYLAVNVPNGVNGTCTVTINQYAAAGVWP